MRLIPILLMVFLLSGCSWLTSNDARTLSRVEFAISTGVSAFIYNDPGSCARALEITDYLLQTVEVDGKTTVAEIVGLAKSSINWKRLNNEQTMLVLGAFGYAEFELTASIEEGSLNNKYVMSVLRFIYLINHNVKLACHVNSFDRLAHN